MLIILNRNFKFRQWIVSATFLFSLQFLQAQNLVLNPSFESGTIDCEPNGFANFFPICAEHWSSPNSGTPDVYSTSGNPVCFTVMPYTGLDLNIYQAHMGSQLPRTGKKFAGIFTFSRTVYNPAYREYIQGQLSEPLIPGEYYCAKMYVSRASYLQYASSNMGIYVGDFINIEPYSDTALRVHPQVVFSQIITEDQQWTEISGTFRATTAAQYVIVGNFSKDNEMQWRDMNGGKPSLFNYPHAYYYIDDVSVEIIPRKLTFTGDRVICSGSTTDLVVKEIFDQITWTYDGDTTRALSEINSLSIKQVNKTRYRVRALRCGRTVIDTISIGVYKLPKVELGRDTMICANTILRLNAGTDGNKILWQDNSTNQFFNVAKAGNYFVTVTNQYNCQSIDKIKVSVRNPPAANLGKDTVFCNAFNPLFASNGNSYLWSTGSLDSTLTPSFSGTYWVTIQNQCGISNDTIQLFSMKEIFIPNVITLNGDIHNEQFQIKGIGENYKVSLTVIDRLGKVWYSNDDYKNQWPSPGQWPEAGTLYYLINFSGCRSYKGWLEVIR